MNSWNYGKPDEEAPLGGGGDLGLAYSAKITHPSRNYRKENHCRTNEHHFQ